MTAVMEGPHLINPFELLKAHGISSNSSEPRHDCRCGASFVIDVSAERPFEHSAGHLREVMIAAAQAASAFLTRARNKGIDLPDSVRDMLVQVAADTGD